MFSLDSTEFIYEPYPIGYARPVFPPAVYETLCSSYPGTELFEFKANLGRKSSLSELNNPHKYHAFLRSSKPWSEFHRWIKSKEFIFGTLSFLSSRNIDLALNNYSVASHRKSRHASAWSRLTRKTELSARFEFSIMDPQGGHILPHTDSPNKIVTLVLSIIGPQEWDDAWGGGTQVCLPIDRTRIFNQANKYMKFEEMEVIRSYDFRPNQCILFIKTYNSWHQVAPIRGPAGAPMRKTLTINIESKT